MTASRSVAQGKTRRGSTKIITASCPGVLTFYLTDGWSSHDRGTSPQKIPGMGVSRCACAVQSFKVVQQAGLPTHYLDSTSDKSFHVQEFAVPGQESLSGKSEGRVLPLEWIWRKVASRTVVKRIAAGTLAPQELGFEPGTKVEEGMELPKLRLECTTKFEPVDRPLTDAQARELAGLDIEQWSRAQRLIAEAVEMLRVDFKRVGFNLQDGKFELGMRHDGTIVLVDVFGTQDENRIVDTKTQEIHDKDLIRRHLEGTDWYAKLAEAKKKYPNNKNLWPPYPSLPLQLVRLVSRRYEDVPRMRAA